MSLNVSTSNVLSDETLSKVSKIHSIVSSDVNDRGMKHLIVDGDFLEAAKLFARLTRSKNTPEQPSQRQSTTDNDGIRPTVLLLSGFPCLVDHDPPTETDGPNGTFALAYCAVALGYRCVIVTDECNAKVFEAGLKSLLEIMSLTHDGSLIDFKVFEGRDVITLEDENNMKELASMADLIVACERAGPASDGNCYTMRGIDMTSRKLIAPLHKMMEYTKNNRVTFIGIGDGGNELGMGKVIERVKRHIPMGETIGCVVPADYLIAASVSNWGAYALCGAAALIRAEDSDSDGSCSSTPAWMKKCLVTEEEDLNILKECMKAGCRDGVNGRLDEPFVDGMPAEKSLECLRAIWDAALGES
eukprot:CCRYP_010578-RA/>CCRYP_010578-RA protein AED:0.01 eAED:-0.00 QI:0/-1/0/1/-1/1/1/0/358